MIIWPLFLSIDLFLFQAKCKGHTQVVDEFCQHHSIAITGGKLCWPLTSVWKSNKYINWGTGNSCLSGRSKPGAPSAIICLFHCIPLGC
ncbi:hypothetical protein M404DRAFT_845497 [Pisolithus tinctorius Marx 270]|uniref:Secreted protein n=1 Tax=Pisolithus tinctorius Marx 270 TaxID=870435 RepID=A0A0C3NT15_PISTI|nr:hypothetical protein M404DRAFT_845497 [Pisolithus tinctorius Marx 270]